MSLRFLPDRELSGLLDGLASSHTVLVPEKGASGLAFSRWESGDGTGADGRSPVVAAARPVEPLKAFLFRAREKVADGFEDVVPPADGKPLCVVGVKACDLQGLAILDAVFIGPDYTDPLYARGRASTLIVSADCTEPLDVCFCRALRLDPHPREGFDLNLAAVEGGFVVESGSERGEKVLDKLREHFTTAADAQVAERDRVRAATEEAVDRQVREHGIPALDRLDGAIRRSYDAPLWEEEAERCVECGACNTICPTCHCFLLHDRLDGDSLARFRLWDSCLIKDFARVAGGANPRSRLWMRLRNRFEKKFDYFPRVHGITACTGCGRCVRGCPAGIDIREVLRRTA